MRKTPLVVSLLVALLVVASPAFAQVNHGDFLGTNVDFLQVTETTQTADPAVLWGAPALAGGGDQLAFFPAAFISECTGGASDQTSSLLTTTIMTNGVDTIDTLALVETGDVTLTSFPPFGTPATNATASMSGTLTVIEDTGGAIAPVAIPFSGTFVPSGTFSLPGDFGASTWSGSISIDVQAQVPNATKATLELDNDLASDCAPGNTVAKIQKKTVSGPSVAIMVNPIACDLEIEKTCCVTQPVLPDLGSCEGDMISATFEFTGDSCRHSNNDQGRSFRCHGRRSIEGPADITILRNAATVSAVADTDIEIGDEVTFSSSTGTLPDKLKFKTTGDWWRKQYLKINTSCDRAFECGDQFGAYKVTGFESTLGGVADCNAPPPPPVCAVSGDPVGTSCDAKVIDMVLEYNGQDCQNPLPNPQNGEAVCSGDATGAVNVGITYTGQHASRQIISPASNINDGDRIRVTSTFRSGMHPNQKYLITDGSGVRQSIEFHTSCSQPLALGDEFGSFKLVEFTTKNGTVAALGTGGDGTSDVCEVPLAPKGPHCTSDLQEITLVYIGDLLGEGCTVSNSQYGYAHCSGVDDPGDPVSIAVAAGLEADPLDQIEFGDLVTITGDNGGELPTFTNIDVTGAGGTQWIQFKSSCQKPLSLGDRFGSFVVFAMDREDEGPISLGGTIQYQYQVTNPNSSQVDNVAIDDDILGEIVSGVSLAPSESQTFTKDALIFGTVTNTGTVTGDIGGDLCTPAEDTATVEVDIPPYGSFTCSEPLTELTLIWNGAETVDLSVWEGASGSSTLLSMFEDVSPGDSVTVTGIGADYPTIEIFSDATTLKIGESSFDLWCNDWAMNGVEDCGKNVGNLKTNEPTLINDWLLEGMVDTDETLECTPGLPPGIPPACGFGPELLFVMPGLMWLHRRRLGKKA